MYIVPLSVFFLLSFFLADLPEKVFVEPQLVTPEKQEITVEVGKYTYIYSIYTHTMVSH